MAVLTELQNTMYGDKPLINFISCVEAFCFRSSRDLYVESPEISCGSVSIDIAGEKARNKKHVNFDKVFIFISIFKNF